MIDYSDGMDTAGSGTYPTGLTDPPVGNLAFFTDDEPAHGHTGTIPQTATSAASGHSHTVDPASFAASTTPAHSHQVSLAAMASTTAGSHAHALDIAATATTTASTANVIPYIQLLLCRKD
jgi:hypothetical protein